MEELHSGRISRAASGSRRNGLFYPCAAPRVLICADSRRNLHQFCTPLLPMGAKIAIFNTIDAVTSDLGADHGYRYYNLSSIPTAEAFADLVKAWRDIDIFVLADDLTAIRSLIRNLDNSLPYPNGFGHPVIIVRKGAISRDTDSDAPVLPDLPDRPELQAIPWLALKSNSGVREISFSSDSL